jgi:hypothetical protein
VCICILVDLCLASRRHRRAAKQHVDIIANYVQLLSRLTDRAGHTQETSREHAFQRTDNPSRTYLYLARVEHLAALAQETVVVVLAKDVVECSVRLHRTEGLQLRRARQDIGATLDELLPCNNKSADIKFNHCYNGGAKG